MKIIELLEAQASYDELKGRFGDFPPEDMEWYPSNYTLEPAATLWSAYDVIQDILGSKNVTTDDEELKPGMYYVYQSNFEPMFRATDDEQGGGSINLPNLESTAAGDIAVAAHEACHALAHKKAKGGRVYSNEKVINNMAEKWLRKHLGGTQLHAALERIVKSRINYGPHHMPKPHRQS